MERLLLEYVATGRENDMEFAIGILRAYDGSPAIMPVCKAIIKAVPERSRLWNEVGAAIETTGVVSGEFGMAEAYERKLTSLEPWKTDEDERVRSFAEWLSDGLVNFIAQERQRAEQGVHVWVNDIVAPVRDGSRPAKHLGAVALTEGARAVCEQSSVTKPKQ